MGDDDEMALFFYEPLSVNFGGYFYSDPHAPRSSTRRLIPLTYLREAELRRAAAVLPLRRPADHPLRLRAERDAGQLKVQGLRTLLNQSWRLEDVWLNLDPDGCASSTLTGPVTVICASDGGAYFYMVE